MNKELFWSQLPEFQKEAAEILFEAQEKNLRVSIQAGMGGKTVGRVSNLRLENGEMVFEIENKRYEPFGIINVEILGRHVEVTSASDILQNTPGIYLKAVAKLLEAQENGSRVSIKAGMGSKTVGRVSNIRIENGKLLFEIESKRYEPFGFMNVEILGHHVELPATTSLPGLA